MHENYIGGGKSGLANIGNTCYLNSCLQVLSHTYEFSDFLSKNTYCLRLDGKKEPFLISEWDKLRQLMWSKNCTIAPWGFFKAIQSVAQRKNSLFVGFSQNDAQEFLLFLIEAMHEDLKREVQMSIQGVPKNNTDHLAQKCYKMVQNMFSNEYSELIPIFYGIQITEISSLDTNDVLSIKPDPFAIINLPIIDDLITPNRRMLTIYDCFDNYCSKELMNGENAWFNEKLNKKQDINKRIIFWSLPNILIIDLKRFNNTNRKIQNIIEAPLEDLDLSKYIIGYDKKSYVYDLYAVINHSGGTYGGHYTANVKIANGEWYNFNDTLITKLSINSVITAKSYCFFYRKKNKI